MKKSVLLALIFLVAFLGSCKDGNGLFNFGGDSEELLNLQKENARLKSQLESIQQKHNSEITEIRAEYEQKLAELQQKLEAGGIGKSWATIAEENTYFIILGSFKNSYFAETYAEKARDLGYEGKILSGPDDFHLVTYGTYKNLQTALPELEKARSNISVEAWIFYVK